MERCIVVNRDGNVYGSSGNEPAKLADRVIAPGDGGAEPGDL